ncbi:uncharacterized protein C4orf17 homolog isoform X2 [Sphaerodactylus townsendi]|uniref:uncharacterized protein C4orf17 homolog isoform X2 n=1 Tax=Sphaerodactylus townsendi TaxID=933632 RepID=UPI002026FF0D|nr:uncharacterized protein C4orf17 homolog isoform X2 [Sphaerodactylus townsendi]
MNINFRTQADPLLSPKKESKKSWPNEGNVNFRRKSAQWRTVCNLKGSKDESSSVMRDLDHISGRSIMPRIEQGPSQMCTRISGGHSLPGGTTINLQSLTSKRHSSPLPISYDMKEDFGLFTNKTWNTSVLKKKICDQKDLLRKSIPEHPPISDVRAIPPTLAFHYRPVITDKTTYTSTYLDHEIKMLEKLGDILQTDSIGEIKDWVSKANLNDRESDNLFTGREKIRIPTSDSSSLEHSPSSPKKEERRHTSPAIPQDSGQLIYKRYLSRLQKPVRGENIPSKKL